MSKNRIEETQDGTVVFKAPFPKDIKQLGNMGPMIIKRPYLIEYVYSYGQDSPFFAALSNKVHLGCRCPKCSYSYATPRKACEYCGVETEWIELPETGVIHSFTVCHFGAEKFLPETPFILGIIQYENINTLFLSRLVGFETDKPNLDWVGKKVKRRFIRNAKMLPTDIYYVPHVSD